MEKKTKEKELKINKTSFKNKILAVLWKSVYDEEVQGFIFPPGCRLKEKLPPCP